MTKGHKYSKLTLKHCNKQTVAEYIHQISLAMKIQRRISSAKKNLPVQEVAATSQMNSMSSIWGTWDCCFSTGLITRFASLSAYWWSLLSLHTWIARLLWFKKEPTQNICFSKGRSWVDMEMDNLGSYFPVSINITTLVDIFYLVIMRVAHRCTFYLVFNIVILDWCCSHRSRILIFRWY